MIYDFISMQILNLMKSSATIELFFKDFCFIACTEVFNVIVFVQMNVKYWYDEKHQSLFMKFGDYALIRLHREYDILFTTILSLKLSQQYARSFKILEKINRLTYRLKLSLHWHIYSMLLMTQLKSTVKEINFYNCSRSDHSPSIFVKRNINIVRLYRLKKMINKCSIKRRNTKYLIKLKEYDEEYDEWRNLSEMKNIMNLICEYKNLIRNIIDLFKRLQELFATKRSLSSIEKAFIIFINIGMIL